MIGPVVVSVVSTFSLLLASHPIEGQTSTCLNRSFEHAEILAGHELLWNLATGDLDGDGDLDLVAVGIYPFDHGIFSVHKNRGDGSFDASTLYTVGGDPRCVLIEDIDADSDLDIIVSNGLGGTLFVYLNPGSGVFEGPSSEYVFPEGVGLFVYAAGDLDNDGDLDLALSDGYGSVRVLWNRGDGTFNYGPSYELLSDGFLYEIVAGDLNGDAFLDLAVLAIPYDAPNYTVLVDDAQVFVLTNDGNLGFGNLQGYDAPSWPTVALAAADVDADGDLDLAGVNSGNARPDPNGMWLLLNDGTGHFGAPIVYRCGSQPYDLSFGDVDGDGDLDAIIPDNESPRIPAPHHVSILFNRGDGTFGNPQRERVGFLPISAVFADLNADGHLDVLVANFAGYGYMSSISVLTNLCDHPLLGDLDLDGYVDLRDYACFQRCFTGVDGASPTTGCGAEDFDGDNDMDLLDWREFQAAFAAL